MSSSHLMNRALVVLSLLAVSRAAAAQASSPLEAGLDSVLSSFAAAGTPFSGVVAIVTRDGKTIQRTRGFASYELKVPVTADMVFRIASISKQFTGALVAMLADEGKIDENAPIGTYLHELRGTPAGDSIKVHNLLTHSAGLEDPDYLWQHVSQMYEWDWKANRPVPTYTIDSVLRDVAREKLKFSPGSSYEYCNVCYVMAGEIIARVSGRTFEATLQDRILKPLAMKTTGVDHIDELVPMHTANYERTADGAIYPITRWRNLAPIAPAGGLHTTMADLRAWARTVFFSDSLLSIGARKRLLTPHEFLQGYGLVVTKARLADSSLVDLTYHTGEIAGTHALVAYLPQSDAVVLVLSNLGFTYPHAALRKALLTMVSLRATH
jgi:D-alanyl-D-alanine carboxypeptidase